MFNKHLFFSLFFVQIICSGELVVAKQAATIGSTVLKQMGESISSAGSVVSLTDAACDTVGFIKSQVAPNEDEWVDQQQQKYKINILIKEAVFRKCLVENAFNSRATNHLPMACQVAAIEFIEAADVGRFQSLRGEFVAATSEFDANGQPVEKGWSWTKRILVGGVIVVTAGAGAIMLAPVLFPGTTAAAQAQTIQSTVSTMSIAAQTMAIDQAGQLAVIAANNKLAAAAIGVSVAGAVRKAVCPTQAEELHALEAEKQARPSLREQIRQAYQVPAAK